MKTLDRVNTVVIGTGCAGYNAADWLYTLGVTDVLIITEGVNMGTSRNTGSDKQTYYKLSLSGDEGDSVGEMAKSLASYGADRDTALIQAAESAECFMKLRLLGVNFPKNSCGEYVGYRTDHDVRQRATSVGPLTSKMMTEALEKSVRQKGIPVLGNAFVCEILTTSGAVAGVQAVDTVTGETYVIPCENVIACTGGPALAYRDSVYPASQSGSMGLLMRAGARLVNMDIWQYGLASTGFRWNVSGSYQQVLPRFYSEDADGNQYEFLEDTDINLCFRKGYEWPFDSKKLPGSSEVDLKALEETRKGRRVFMDFTKNPAGFAWDKLSSEALDYLTNCGALQDTPIARLEAMNAPAIQLYLDHGIDIKKEPLEVRVCAQHLNGGAEVDTNWETCVKGLYVAGEAAGTFGKTRPGGSALNATQVGSLRAAEHIASKARAAGEYTPECARIRVPSLADFEALRTQMSQYAAISRDKARIAGILAAASAALANAVPLEDIAPRSRHTHLRAREAVYAVQAVCACMLSEETGEVRGVRLDGGAPVTFSRPARPVADRELWFERVYGAKRD